VASAFSSGIRSKQAAAHYDGSWYSDIDQSVRPQDAEFRRLIDVWIDAMPNQGGLIGRLRSGKNDKFESVLWELFLYQAYTTSGYDLQIEPVVASGKQPDFLVEGHGQRFYLEAVRASDSAYVSRDERLLGTVCHALSSLRAEQFWLSMSPRKVGPNALNIRPLKWSLIKWVNSLDPGIAERARKIGRYPLADRWQWSDAGWLLNFAAFPVSEQGLGRAIKLLRVTEGFAWADDKTRIRKALDRKAHHYGELDAPLVVAVLCNTSPGVVDTSDVEDVLYGELIGHHATSPLPPERAKILEPGLWLSQAGQWKRPDIPQVITAMNVPSLRIPVCQPLLWKTLASKAACPTQPGWLAPVHMSPQGPRAEKADSTAQLLGLPEDWPLQPAE
jgi:hypothetical protein